MAKEHGNYPIAEEKPEHYRYIKNFRTQQCRAFLEHRCDKSKPYTCFDYHYENQKRRVPKRDPKDGTFNYSPNEFCADYDPTKGICPRGPGCRLLHKTSGDTERLYHLRYYKTQMCQHGLDAKGHCTRNGPHCAFAHQPTDIRSPVYDAAELRSLEQRKPAGAASSTAVPTATNAAGPASSGSGSSNIVGLAAVANAEPDWKSPANVLAHFKTEHCANPMRVCIGPTCPRYHNPRDRRRSPYSFSYRPQPCSDVKVADSWKDPSSCQKGDKCIYSHTRYEQQFHPEIYKSAFCVDHNAGRTCPRGDFCAFAHGDGERAAVDRVRSQVVPAAATTPTPLLPAATAATASAATAAAATASAATASAATAAAATAVLPPGATKQPPPLSVVAPPPGLLPIQPIGAPARSVAQLLAASSANPSNGGQLSGKGLDIRGSVTTGGIPPSVGEPSESISRSTWSRTDPPMLAQSNPIANFAPATTAGAAAGLTVGDMMKPEELNRLIDADTTIDALEQKRRKKIVSRLSGDSNFVSYRLYTDTVLGTAGRTDDYLGAGASSGPPLFQLQDVFLPGNVAKNLVLNDRAKHVSAQANGADRQELLLEDKVQRALLDSQLILNQAKLKVLSRSELRAVKKQLQQYVNMIDEMMEA